MTVWRILHKTIESLVSAVRCITRMEVRRGCGGGGGAVAGIYVEVVAVASLR